MFCKNCGKEIDENNKFCNFCGEKVFLIKKTKIIKNKNIDDKEYVWTCDFCKKEFASKVSADAHEKICELNLESIIPETGLEIIPNIKDNKTKEIPSFWKWYFSWNPRTFLTAPIFVLFTYHGFWFIWAEITDIVLFFQKTPITWLSIFFILVLGSFFIWFFLAPIYISFFSITWLYEINIENYKKWKKFLYSIGIILLVTIGTTLIRLLTRWILGIL